MSHIDGCCKKMGEITGERILIFGGSGPSTATELWNGTSWTSNPTGLATARYEMGSAGTQTTALAFGGSPVNLTTTEEWNTTALQTKTITVS